MPLLLLYYCCRCLRCVLLPASLLRLLLLFCCCRCLRCLVLPASLLRLLLPLGAQKPCSIHQQVLLPAALLRLLLPEGDSLAKGRMSNARIRGGAYLGAHAVEGSAHAGEGRTDGVGQCLCRGKSAWAREGNSHVREKKWLDLVRAWKTQLKCVTD